MKKVKAKLEFPADVVKFCNLMETEFDCDVDIVKNNYIINAKSLLSVLSLNTPEGFEVVLNSDDELLENKFIAIMRQFQECD